MFEYIFTFGCFDKFHEGHIELFKSIQNQCEKIIVGLYNNDNITKLKNITNVDSYDIRKKNVERYADDIFMIDEIDPVKSIEEYISKRFNDNILPLNIGSSKNNNKVINKNYKGELFFIHDYKDTFEYHYNDNTIIITRTDQNSGWGQNLLAYKKNWCFMRGDNNKNFPGINYVKSVMPIKYLPYSKEILLEKMNDNIKIIDIDMVFTYVNGYDPEFINLKNKYISDENKKYYPDIRNKGIDEIIFSVNSVIKYIPWIRTIFIVTSLNQIPPIDKELIQSGKVVIIDDKTIIEHIYLPTFNSDTIESYLHNIPGLSEIFLYNNDDMMHFDYVHRSDIYKIENDKIVIKLINNDNYTIYLNRIVSCLSLRKNNPLNLLLINNHKYIKYHNKLLSKLSKKFNFGSEYAHRIFNTIDFLLELNGNESLYLINNHHTKILRKSTLKYIEEKYSNKLTEMRNHRFRGPNYIQYLFFAINIDNMLNNNIIIKNKQYVYEGYFDNKNYKEGVFDNVLKMRPKFVCLNSMNNTYRDDFFKFINKII